MTLSKKIKDYILKNVNTTDSKGPSISTCESHFTCSRSLIQKVYKSLINDNIFINIHGKGYFLVNKQPKNITNQKTSKNINTLIQRLYDHIIFEVKSGEDLPSFKELALNCSMDYRTVKKLLYTPKLNHLIIEESGKLRRRKKHFSENKAVIIWVAFSQKERLKITSDREREFHSNLFKQAKSYKIDLEILLVNDREGFNPSYKEISEKAQKLIVNKTLLGYVFSSWHFKNPYQMIRELERSQLPISVWVEDASLLNKTFNRQVNLFNITFNPIHGSRVGEYLFNKGDFDVHFFSPFQLSQWSKDRLEGLQNFLNSKSQEVISHCLHQYESEWQVPVSQADPQEIQDSALWSNREYSNAYRLLELERDKVLYYELETLFEKAFKLNTRQAWVLANDRIALLVYEYFKSIKLNSDQWPLLISFDNSSIAYELGLNSYQFKTDKMTKIMIESICNPKLDLHLNKMDFTGEIVEKQPLPF